MKKKESIDLFFSNKKKKEQTLGVSIGPKVGSVEPKGLPVVLGPSLTRCMNRLLLLLRERKLQVFRSAGPLDFTGRFIVFLPPSLLRRCPSHRAHDQGRLPSDPGTAASFDGKDAGCYGSRSRRCGS